jgi:hypothetical protein
MQMIYKGSCHCGSITAEFETQSAPRLRCDGCSFCRSRGVKVASDPHGALRLRADEPMIRYRFGHGTADFLICSRCGTNVAAIMEGPKGLLGVANVVGLAIPELMDASAELSSLDGETAEDRIARRVARWTPTAVTEAKSRARN